MLWVCWFKHKWTKWGEVGRYGTNHAIQYRRCYRCGVVAEKFHNAFFSAAHPIAKIPNTENVQLISLKKVEKP